MTRSMQIVGTRTWTLLLQLGCIYASLALSLSIRSPTANCPPLNVSEHNHSPLVDFADQGTDVSLFQVLCTEPDTATLNGHWKYDTGPLGPHVSSKVIYTARGSVCANFSLQLFDVDFATSDGYYTLTASSDCGSHANRTFSLSVSGCPCDSPPEPKLLHHAPQLVAKSDAPKNFSLLKAYFHGCASDLQYDSVVQVNSTAVCTDDEVFRGNYKCARITMNECLFIVEVTAVEYGLSNSGQYCTHSQSQDRGNSSNNTCFQTKVLPWPAVTGPSDNVSTSLNGGTLRWRVHNFFPAGLVITAYKDYVQTVDTRTEAIPDTTDAFVFIDVARHTSGRYQLLIKFTDNVYTEDTGFNAVWSAPGYARDNGVNAAAVAVPIAFVLSFAVLCSVSYGVYWWRKRGPTGTHLQERALSQILSGDTQHLLEPVGVEIKGSASRNTNYGSGANYPVISNPTVNSGSPLACTDSAFSRNSPPPSQASANVQHLMSHSKTIMASVKPAALLPHLQSKELVTPEESEYISSSSTNHQRTQLIIQALLSKGDDAVERFIAALSEEIQHPPHQQLAKRLTQALEGSPPTSPTSSPAVRDVIYPHMPALISRVNPIALLPQLIGHELVTDDDADHIQNPTRTDLQRIQYITIGLFYCGERAVETFIWCLIEERTHPPHQELAELLIKQLSQQEQHRELADSLERDLKKAKKQGPNDRQGSGESEESTEQGSGESEESTEQGSGESAG